MECWASILGDCEGGQSSEHYLTKGLYDGIVTATGLPWSKGEPVKLPIRCFAANILCRKHNEALSGVDAEAIRMKDFIVEAVQAIGTGSGLLSGMKYDSFDGTKIVRWLSKMICNLDYLADQPLDPAFIHHAFGLPHSPVHVYIDKPLPFASDGDYGHFSFWRWYADIKGQNQKAVYIFTFGLLEWLVAPFALTQGECDKLAHASKGQCCFVAKPLNKNRAIPIGEGRVGKGVRWSHQLLLRFPKKRSRKRA